MNPKTFPTILFSVVTPCYNGEKFIKNCIESVRYACNGLAYEHIVADGGSTDATLEILKNYPEVKVFSEKDKGMYDALNKGIIKAQGLFIGHLNVDEQYNKQGLQAAIGILQKNCNIDAVMSPTVMLNHNLDFIYYLKQNIAPAIADTHWYMPVQSCSLLFKKDRWERIPYDDQYRLVADHVWFRKQMQAGLNIVACTHPIGIFVWHPNNLSNTEGKTSNEDALSDINKKGIYIKYIKLRYRLRKYLAGGYKRETISYDLYKNGSIHTITIKKPKLRL